jgi:UDP-2-acetamido-3-amino-2,3-dideoxy-glucuronate N-acetyltransferase
MTRTSDVKILDFKSFHDIRGSLCPIDFSDLPIEVKRIFYVHNVPDKKLRGEHSHYTTNQILVCLSGSCTVICKDGKEESKYLLNTPTKGLLIPSMIWDEQIYNSDKTILLVLSDTQYDKDDYIKDWNEYLKIKESNNA